MKKLIATCLLAASLLYFGPVLGGLVYSAEKAPTACPGGSSADLVSILALRVPKAKVIVLSGGTAKSFIVAFNSMPPISKHVADELVIIDFEPALILDAQFMYVVMFVNGCMVSKGTIPKPVVRGLLNNIARSGA